MDNISVSTSNIVPYTPNIQGTFYAIFRVPLEVILDIPKLNEGHGSGGSKRRDLYDGRIPAPGSRARAAGCLHNRFLVTT